MTNSVDPDQTALKEQSDLGLHILSHLSLLMLRFLKVFNILNIMQNILRKKHFDTVSEA